MYVADITPERPNSPFTKATEQRLKHQLKKSPQCLPLEALLSFQDDPIPKAKKPKGSDRLSVGPALETSDVTAGHLAPLPLYLCKTLLLTA